MAFREIVDKIIAIDPNNGKTITKEGSVPKWD